MFNGAPAEYRLADHIEDDPSEDQEDAVILLSDKGTISSVNV